MILLIAPGSSAEVYQGLNDLTAVEPPIWAALLHNALNKSGYESTLIDQEAEVKSDSDILNDIKSLKPKLVVIVVYGHQPSASTQSMHGASRLINVIAESQIPMLLVGGHPSALPVETLEKEKIDFVAKGEGLNVIRQFVDRVKLEEISGLYYKPVYKKAILHPNQKDTIASNLDLTFPGIDWDKLPMHKYRAHLWHVLHQPHTINSYAAIYTSLGCPFKCSFCCINAPFSSNSFRFWSPKHTVNQIEILVGKFGIQNLKIADEMFVLKEEHFLGICNEIIKRKIKVNIWAYARVDTVKQKYLETLKAAGVNWLALGIESGSQHVRDGVTKGRFKIDDITRTVEEIRKSGIYTIGNYIFGLPDDTEESMEETLEMALSLNTEFANFYSAMAYPGSALYTQTEPEDLPESYLGYSQHAYETKPLKTKTCSAATVLKFRDEAHTKYFTDPSYLTMVGNTFGKPGLDLIETMNKKTIKRKLYEGS